MSDVLSILSHNSLLLTKTWQKDGTIKPYGNALNYNLQKITVNNICELSALLTKLERKPKSCLIRGAYTGTETKKILRRKDFFKDQALHTLCIDIDKYEPVSADPVLDPVSCIDEFIAEHLPEAFAAASYHWQLSTSAGHPSKQGILKVHVWFWLAKAANCASLHAWATDYGINCDKALFDEIQIHYTAAPAFEQGLADPVPVRSGFCAGVANDEVNIDIPYIEPQQGKVRNRSIDAAAGEDDEDEVSAALKEMDCYKGRNRDGSVAIVCPFSAQHSDGIKDSMTTTVYWLSGTGDFEQGHFDCRHDGCRARSDEEFKVALGLTEEGGGFDVVEDPKEIALPDLPKMHRNAKGQADATIPYLLDMLRRSIHTGFDIKKDMFREEVMISPFNKNEWRPLEDTDYTTLREILERRWFKPVAKELIRDVIHKIAKENSFDTAKLWIENLKWDGVARINTFIPVYFKTKDSEYERAVSLYMWTAMAGRVLIPGIKADMVPVFIGKQGAGKSTGVAELSPSSDFYTTISLSERDDNLSRLMRGKLILEIAEMKGVASRDDESIKEFITRQSERWIPKFQEKEIEFKRRALFIGTNNKKEFLGDTTGNRRWLPVDCGSVDIEKIKKDRLQLWAEGRDIFLKKGVLYEDAERLAKDLHNDYRLPELYAERINEWLHTKDTVKAPIEQEYITSTELFSGALDMSVKMVKRSDEMRVANILKEMGFYNKVIWNEGKSIRAWFNSKTTS